MESVKVGSGLTEAVEPADDLVAPRSSASTESTGEQQGKMKCPWRPTIVLSFANFGMGLVSTTVGTTLVHMGLLFNVSVATISLTLSLESVGYLVGCVLYGLLASRLDYDCTTATTVLLMGLLTICAPLVSGFPGFASSMTARGIASGVFNPHIALYCLTAWMYHRCRDSALQFQNAFNALGEAIGPLIINIFMVDITPKKTVENSTMHSNDITVTPSSTDKNNSIGIQDEDGLQRVIGAYVVIGLIMVVCAVPAVILFVWRHGDLRLCQLATPRCPSIVDALPTSRSTATTGVTSEQPFRRLHLDTLPARRRSTAVAAAVSYVIIVFFVGFFCGPSYFIPRSFLSTFAIKQLSWSSSDATLLVSVYGGAHCVGLLIGVPLSAVASPGRLLIGQAMVATMGLIALLAAGVHTSPPVYVTWISVTVVGLGLSTFKGLVFLILFEYRYVGIIDRATMSTAVSVGITAGMGVSATVVGYLSDVWTPLSIIYSTIGSLGCLLAVLGIRLTIIDWLQRLTSTTMLHIADDKNECATETTPLSVKDNLS